jgi:hypothetical protein
MHTQDQGRGIRAEDIKRGTIIGGRRVSAMTVGLVNGQRATTVRFPDTDRKGRPVLSAPVRYIHGTWVGATRTPTTWAIPAGPVGRTPFGKLHGGWYGDPDSNDRDARADRHNRKINALTYR